MTDVLPDAIQAPVGYAGAGDAASRLGRLQTEFGPLLGVSTIFVRNQGGTYFITGNASDTLLFPQDHARAGKARYRWVERGDGVSYGRYLADG